MTRHTQNLGFPTQHLTKAVPSMLAAGTEHAWDSDHQSWFTVVGGSSHLPKALRVSNLGPDLHSILAFEKEQLSLTEHLLCARHSRCFGHILLLNSDTICVIGCTTFPILEIIRRKFRELK